MRAPPRDVRPAGSTTFRFAGADGLSIACRRWEDGLPARAIVQIAHGLGEHIGRYAETVGILLAAGFKVYANDHRGHGRTATGPERRGDFGLGGFDNLVDDMLRLSRIARDQNPGLPLILLGHGMGSFAAQQMILSHSGAIDGLVLSGSGILDGLAVLARSSPAGMAALNAAFEPARTPFDWLSRDEAVVDSFIADPLCFPELQPNSLASFLAAAERLSDPLRLRIVRKDLPIHIISGSDDPVGQQLEGVGALIHRYRQAGLYEISHDFYQGGRHELLNETSRASVRADLIPRMLAMLRPPNACARTAA
jgi:alpha-beta hydrolase superfamily lysophospholipase